MASRFKADRELSARMVLVMFLLGLLYVAAIAALIAYGVNAVAVLVIAAGALAAQWYFSDKVALAAMGAREVTPAQAPELHGVIDRLTVLADMPKPRIAISDIDTPNAFATGRSQQHSVVVVTTGLLRRLDRSELEAVLAHELSHIAHRDVAVMTVASFLGVLAGFVARMSMYSGIGRSRDQRQQAAILMVVLVSVLVYAISFLLLRALSRYRELAADRAAAYLTGQPSALAGALTKISGQMAAIPTGDLRKMEPVNAFMFAPAATKTKGFSLGQVFATHPPLEKRIAQLAKVATELGRPL